MSNPLGPTTPIGMLLEHGDIGEETAQQLRDAIREDRDATWEAAYRRGFEDAKALAIDAIRALQPEKEG